MPLIEIKNPSPRELRQFAVVWLPCFAALAGTLLLIYGSGAAMVVVFIWLAVLGSAGLGYRSPNFVRPFFLGWIYAAYPIGWLVSHLSLVVIYYLVMTPIGWALKVFKHDSLQRSFDRSASTYWVAHNPGGPSWRYFRQF